MENLNAFSIRLSLLTLRLSASVDATVLHFIPYIRAPVCNHTAYELRERSSAALIKEKTTCRDGGFD